MREFKGYRKGVNLGGWLSQCRHTKEHYDTFITERDIQRIAGMGADHIRLPLDYETVEAPDGTYDESGFAYIDTCIAWCKKYNLNLILDLHKTAGYSFNDQAASAVFFSSEPLQERFVKLWEALAKRYGRYESMMAFELLNELVNEEIAGIWNKIARRAIEAIRIHAPTIKILVGGVYYNSIFGLEYLDAPYDENIIYNFHCYEPLIFTHQSASWTKNMPQDLVLEYPGAYDAYKEKTKILDSISNNKVYDCNIANTIGPEFFENLFSIAADIAEKRDVPLYCGEYGVIDKAPLESTLNWYRDIHAAFEKFGIGRAAWSYKKMSFGLIDDHYREIYDELITLL